MATYYVDGAVGDDGNAGTAEGAGNALATINAGVLKCTAAGDHLYIKASVTYALGNTSTYPANGTAAAPIITEGYTSTPGDGGQVTIDCASANDDGSYNTRNYHIIKNIIVKNSTLNGFNWGASDYCQFVNCEAYDCTNIGFFADNYNCFDGCTAEGNDEGIYVDYYCTAINCRCVDNNNFAIRCLNYHLTMINCVVAGGNNFVVYCGYSLTAVNCTVDGYGTDVGLNMATGYYPCSIMNCIIHDCTTGIKVNAAGPRSVQIGLNNMMNSNTANYSNWAATSTDFAGDPDFTDEAGGDYSLGASSDARNAAYHGINNATSVVNCGAEQNYTSSGTGTSRVVLTS
jgi:hypothetical protein